MVDAFKGLRATLESSIQAARMKGVVVAFAHGAEQAQLIATGTDAAGNALSETTLFPVASITKVATALSVLRLVNAGRISLDDPLASHVPEAAAAGHWGVTIRRLLSHTAGLPADVPQALAPYADGLTWPVLAEACLQTTLEREPLTRVQYSNVGYGLLAIVVERETGQSFASALEQLVLRPLEIEGYLGPDPPRPPALLAGVRGKHARTELEPFNSRFWRSLALPWAGLVTTAAGSLSLVRAFAGQPAGFLRKGLSEEAAKNQAGELGGGFVRPLLWAPCPWGLGPEIRGRKLPHWTPLEASSTSFGHSGASGCVAWHDPEADVWWAIHGTRTADSGWLIRRAPEIGRAILNKE